MKRFFLANILFGLLLTLLVSGCSTRMIDFTAISSKNMQLQIPPEAMGERVEAEDKQLWLFVVFGYLPIQNRPNLKEAVDRAIESAGPGYDALVDGVVYQTFEYYLLAMRGGYKVVGTPIKTSVMAGSLSRGGISSAKQPVLYHSSLGLSNEAALRSLKIVKADKPKAHRELGKK